MVFLAPFQTALCSSGPLTLQWCFHTWSPGQRVDNALVAGGGVDRRQRVCVPDFDGSIKAGGGQQVGVVRLELAVEYGFHMTLTRREESDMKMQGGRS